MKVLLINTVCGTGSTGRICCDIADKYISEGHECRIAYGRGTAPDKYKNISVRIGGRFNNYIHGIETRLFDNQGFSSRTATKRFLKWAEEYNPDLLWLHNLHGYYINVEQLFAWIKSRPQMKVKWTLHDCWAFTGHCVYFTMAGCDKWKTGCSNCPNKSEYPASNCIDNSGKKYAKKKAAFTNVADMTLITPSEWLAGLVRQSYLKEYPVEVCHNTIDTNIFKPTPSDFREKYGLTDKKVVLGVANFADKRKGFTDFLKLSDMLDDTYRIVLVGLMTRQLSQLPENILGFVKTDSSEQLAQIYTAADIFVNATHEDNYPTVNLEAAACGTPVISYNVGGCPETVQKECLVETGDVEGLKSAIISRL